MILELDSEGAHLVPKTSCEESHRLIVMYNAPNNFDGGAFNAPLLANGFNFDEGVSR